jgi:hypothetical protein
MSPTKIAQLTPEQEAVIPSILEKWTRVFCSTEPSDYQKAEAAVKTAYAAMGKPEPVIRFFSIKRESGNSRRRSPRCTS